jgi:hypothetical protein
MANIRFAVVFYTTTQIDFQGIRRPRQYLLVNKTRAIELGQKTAFHVDAGRFARLPLTADYFPELRRDTIPVRGRDPVFVNKVMERVRELRASGVPITKVDAVAPSRID